MVDGWVTRHDGFEGNPRGMTFPLTLCVLRSPGRGQARPASLNCSSECLAPVHRVQSGAVASGTGLVSFSSRFFPSLHLLGNHLLSHKTF